MKGFILPILIAVAIVLGAPPIATGQFGHPLKGQWSGEWTPGGVPMRLLLDIEWDGKELTGRINPGTPAEGGFTKTTIDYTPVTSWKVQVEAEVKDPAGKAVPVRIDGTLENIGAYSRVFHGTWTQGGRKGPFRVTRN